MTATSGFSAASSMCRAFCKYLRAARLEGSSNAVPPSQARCVHAEASGPHLLQRALPSSWSWSKGAGSALSVRGSHSPVSMPFKIPCAGPTLLGAAVRPMQLLPAAGEVEQPPHLELGAHVWARKGGLEPAGRAAVHRLRGVCGRHGGDGVGVHDASLHSDSLLRPRPKGRSLHRLWSVPAPSSSTAAQGCGQSSSRPAPC